jgi:hypothetical protein
VHQFPAEFLECTEKDIQRPISKFILKGKKSISFESDTVANKILIIHNHNMISEAAVLLEVGG